MTFKCYNIHSLYFCFHYFFGKTAKPPLNCFVCRENTCKFLKLTQYTCKTKDINTWYILLNVTKHYGYFWPCFILLMDIDYQFQKPRVKVGSEHSPTIYGLSGHSLRPTLLLIVMQKTEKRFTETYKAFTDKRLSFGPNGLTS